MQTGDSASPSPPSADHPALARSRLLALLFTDLVGSTGLKDTLKTSGYLPLLKRHDELLRQAVPQAGGQLQQDTGDGCFALFATASQAVNAALLFQWLMEAEPWPAGQKLISRAGVHLGEVAETEVRQDGGNKVVGMAVDLAARVMSLAVGGQILMTRTVFNDARQFIAGHPGDATVALTWIAHGPYLFKGAEEAIDVFEVGVAGKSPLAAPPDSEKARRALRAGDEQTLGWRPAVGLALPGSPMWVVEKKLGEGGFGEVWLARHAKSKAVRVFKFCFDAERLRALKREVVLFRLLKEALGDRRDIARVIDWRFEESPYYIELDYTPQGNLADWAERQGGIAQVSLADRIKIVASIATALGAAHSVGILHKDIKPSNVLMVTDEAGQTYPRLTDFGIGILTDRSRLEQFNITAAGFTASNLTMNESSRTGTRMYAPPESLTDRPHTVQGDVYALGVMLYQMAVGDLAQPLGVGWERQVADELLREDIAACVEGDPLRRLASAADLAKRLETVEQRRSARQRENEQRLTAARRRRRLRLATAGALALAILAGLAAVGLMRERDLRHRAEEAEKNTRTEKERAEKATTRAVEQTLRAERRFNDVRSLADTFMFRVHDAIANLAGSTPARKLLAETSLKYLDSLATEAADTPGLAREVSAAYIKVGDVLGNPQNVNLGDARGALSAYGKSLAIRARLAATQSTSAQAMSDLATVHSKVADVLSATGNTKEALATYEQSLEISKNLLEQAPGDLDAQRALSYGYNRIGDAQLAAGDNRAALTAFQKAMELRVRLANAQPTSALAQRDVSVSHDRIGSSLEALGDSKGALAAYQKALAIRETLSQAEPTDALHRRNLSVSLGRIGDVQKIMGNTKSALLSYRKALEIDSQLSQADPASATARRDVSFDYNRIGDAHDLLGEHLAALDMYRKGLEITQRLASENPGSAAARRDLSFSHNRIGDAQTAMGDKTGALESYQKSLELDLQLASRDAKNAGMQRDLAVSYNKVGQAHEAVKDYVRAMELYRKSLAIETRLLELDPGSAMAQRDLSVSHDRIGDVQIFLENAKAALEAYRTSLAIRQQLAKADPNNAEARRDLGVSHFKIGNVSVILGSNETATKADRQKALEQAVSSFEESRKIFSSGAAQNAQTVEMLTQRLAGARTLLDALETTK